MLGIKNESDYDKEKTIVYCSTACIFNMRVTNFILNINTNIWKIQITLLGD